MHTGSVAARAVAATAVDAVLNKGRNLDDALSDAGIDETNEADRAMVRALVFGTLRTQHRNRRVLDLLADRPFRRRDSVIAALISTGLFALRDARRPDYAVVSTTVDAAVSLGKPGMRGAVNAILRRYLREQDSVLAKVDEYPDAHWLHPEWLIERVSADWPDDWETLLEAGSRQAPMWLRVNLARTDRNSWLDRLAKSGVAKGTAHPELDAALVLDRPVGVNELPGFEAGEVSVQDAASQFAAPLLRPEPGMRVLDACAAPGGKTAHILEHCPELAGLVAVDRSQPRLRRMRENLDRLGLTATVIQGDAADPDGWWDGEPFDRILLDAPCSATGVMRRHPDIAFLRRPGDIQALAGQQEQMLAQLWPLLKPGGRLVYSTCSVLREENEAVVTRVLARTADMEVLDPVQAGGPKSALPVVCGLQLLPGAGSGDTDGFYYALMARKRMV
ncbi:MAG: 16S rRNA (cytosine(967)-C(5))-methyltransferase RsmB [Gammaproteobacteria bacterium]|jgi:16S rRNA (cytosine967-C5)-methyltransferase|nr:16S rRNA (cytosine(967)-C(5))-methyltransferase RsmB [Gammaproteobacteria bacterium]MDP6617534.1 16S rRNA (cytosine(967)-C(5))-methyltransferase RsmB [Gammaproteobacteria bacterium]MDP6694411.1 16S rRNA (cytosine(967)-C(5))-methyltransferase RsmB [Gammaproteobacteria bacterium]MDP7041166.1 16S rRNA (cytosine(967)-C(5))-methyltransferase RsmB [Gammaproteobacteria bacterium]